MNIPTSERCPLCGGHDKISVTVQDGSEKSRDCPLCAEWSKTKKGQCANDGCTDVRRHGSKYCKGCSEAHNRQKQYG